MKDHEINRLIAEKCGWTCIEDFKDGLMMVQPIWRGYPPHGAIVGRKQDIPNYYGSLDACHEFETTICDNDCEYVSELTGSCKTDGWEICSDREQLSLVCATAPQRCEAFLRLHRLWVDEPTTL